MSRAVMTICGTLAALTAFPAFSEGFNGVLATVSVIFAILAVKAYLDFEKEEARKKDECALIEKAQAKLRALTGQSVHKPLLAVILGGSGYPTNPGAAAYLTSQREKIAINGVTDDSVIEIPIAEITDMEISGPGTQTTNAGMIGGGFGLEGAAKGILAAALINAATTRSTTNTLLRVATHTGEIMFHFNDQDPPALRLTLSHLFVALEANKKGKTSTSGDLADNLAKLQTLKDAGTLSEDEFVRAKQKLLGA